MTCLLSKYPVKYVKKILQKIHKLGAGNKKTAIIILFIMMAVTYSILSYTFHLFRRIN